MAAGGGVYGTRENSTIRVQGGRGENLQNFLYIKLQSREGKNKGVTKIREAIEEVIQEIRPKLQLDGGDIELVDVKDGLVKVKLTGACGTCPMSAMTLKFTVEGLLKERVPGIKAVQTV